MKILGINKTLFKGQDGKDYSYYNLFLATKEASDGGYVVRDYRVSSAALQNALKQIKGVKYDQLVGKEVESYHADYDKVKKTNKINILNLK